jgi:hypothetical protein
MDQRRPYLQYIVSLPQPCQTYSTLGKDEELVHHWSCAAHHREMPWAKTQSEPT